MQKTCKNVWKHAKTCISRTHVLKNVQKTCKNVQKRASQVPIYKKTCKNVQNCAKSCKNVQNRAKTCISNIFGPNSKTCTCEVRAAWGRVSRGLTVQVQYMKIPSSEHEEIMMCTEFFFDIQNNLCTQHALPMFCKNKSFWQRFTCNIVKLQIAGHLPIVTEIMKYHPCLYVY